MGHGLAVYGRISERLVAGCEPLSIFFNLDVVEQVQVRHLLDQHCCITLIVKADLEV